MIERNADGLTLEEFLKQYQPKDYRHPALTSDNMIFKYAPELKVLLIRRRNHPCIGMRAFPGGFVNPDENTLAAAKRELEEETGVRDAVLMTVGMFSNPQRDPRDWVVSEGFASLVGPEVTATAADDAEDAEWYSVSFSDKNDVISFVLTGEKDVIKGEVVMHARSSEIGEELNPEIINNDGLAFDHAIMLATALRKAHFLK